MQKRRTDGSAGLDTFGDDILNKTCDPFDGGFSAQKCEMRSSIAQIHHCEPKNFFFQFWRFMDELVKVAGLEMTNLDVGQGLDSDTGLVTFIYAHEVAFEQKPEHLTPSIIQYFKEHQITAFDGKRVPS